MTSLLLQDFLDPYTCLRSQSEFDIGQNVMSFFISLGCQTCREILILCPIQTQPSHTCEVVILLYVFRMRLVYKRSMSTENV